MALMIDNNSPVQRDGSSTPQWLFAFLDEQVRALTGEGFRLDAAACEWNAKCKFYFDERSDALRQDWSKWPTIFCHPPFNAELISQFVTRALDAAERGSTVVFILPSWPGYPWFQDLKRRGQMQDIIGPVAFEHGYGRKVLLNSGRNATSLVVATLGRKVTPGSNGEPIRRSRNAIDRGSSASSTDIAPAGFKAGLPGGPTTAFILTSYHSNNDFLMAQVAKLYFRPGDRIADVTFGDGVFWRAIDLTQYDFHPSDLLTVPDHPYDCRHLPYPSQTFDVHVLDPPYMHSASAQRFNYYKNYQTTKGFSHADIIRLYRDGMREGHRILKPGGLMLVKCKDEMESGQQKMSHIEVHDIAINELVMRVHDLFVLTQRSPLLHFGRSKHARKNHSYLWLFTKND